MTKNKIKFGISKGFLKKPIKRLFKMSGYDLKINETLLAADIDDPEIECFLARAREIAPLVDRGILDGGIVSRVAIAETRARVTDIFDLGTLNPSWQQTKLVLAVPENSSIKSLKDLEKKRIITRVPEITKDFLKKHKISSVIEFSDGINMSKVPTYADAVIEFTCTGATLKFYKLRILSVLIRDSIVVVANSGSLKNKWKKEKIENLGLLLKGARTAQEYNGLMFHASNDIMEEVLRILPALKEPTVTRLRGTNWFDVFTVAKEKKIRELIPDLKKIGCTGIIEFSLNKVI